MSLVVDASVVIKWFVEEVRSDAARLVLDSGEPLIAPDLVVPEVCNVAWKKVRRGELSQEHGAAVARALPMSFDRLIATAELVPRAFSLGHRFDHPLYDCFYIALAEVESATLVTDDGPGATPSASVVCHTLGVSILAVNPPCRGGMVAWPKKQS